MSNTPETNRSDEAKHMGQLLTGSCSAEHRAEALHLVFCPLPELDQQRHVASLLESPAGVLAGLFEARRDGKLAGAVFVQVMAGRVASVWGPQLADGEPESTAKTLLEAAMEYLGSGRVRIAQALLADHSTLEAERLLAAGFELLGDLIYLVSLGESSKRESPTAGGASHGLVFGDSQGGDLQFEPYSKANHGRLAAVLERTYEGTQDCPRLNGVRDIEDVLAGYFEIGKFVPERWFIVRDEAGNDVGCLLLTDHQKHEQWEHEQWELVYMGLAPEVRGRGWGLLVTRYAQLLAREALCNRLVLAVDAENTAALAMYHEAGFAEWDRRSMFLREFELH